MVVSVRRLDIFLKAERHSIPKPHGEDVLLEGSDGGDTHSTLLMKNPQIKYCLLRKFRVVFNEPGMNTTGL